jgi:hypothetical protein
LDGVKQREVFHQYLGYQRRVKVKMIMVVKVELTNTKLQLVNFRVQQWVQWQVLPLEELLPRLKMVELLPMLKSRLIKHLENHMNKALLHKNKNWMILTKLMKNSKQKLVIRKMRHKIRGDNKMKLLLLV